MIKRIALTVLVLLFLFGCAGTKSDHVAIEPAVRIYITVGNEYRVIEVSAADSVVISQVDGKPKVVID